MFVNLIGINGLRIILGYSSETIMENIFVILWTFDNKRKQENIFNFSPSVKLYLKMVRKPDIAIISSGNSTEKGKMVKK